MTLDISKLAPIPCGGCSTKDAPVMLSAAPGTLDQTAGPMAAVVWKHPTGPCEWSRTLRASIASPPAAP